MLIMWTDTPITNRTSNPTLCKYGTAHKIPDCAVASNEAVKYWNESFKRSCMYDDIQWLRRLRPKKLNSEPTWLSSSSFCIMDLDLGRFWSFTSVWELCKLWCNMPYSSTKLALRIERVDLRLGTYWGRVDEETEDWFADFAKQVFVVYSAPGKLSIRTVLATNAPRSGPDRK